MYYYNPHYGIYGHTHNIYLNYNSVVRIIQLFQQNLILHGIFHITYYVMFQSMQQYFLLLSLLHSGQYNICQSTHHLGHDFLL